MEPGFEFVDAHHHLWDLNALDYAWLTGKPYEGHPTGDYSPIARDFTVKELRKAAGRINIIKSVHIETADGETDSLRETEWLQGVAISDGLPSAIIARVDLMGENVEAELERHARYPNFRGARMLSFMGRDFLDDPSFRRGFDALQRRNLIYDLDADERQMAKAKALALRFSDSTIILGHCGFPKQRTVPYFNHWRREIASLAEAPNVACKLSGLGMVDHNWTVETIRPWIEVCIDAFGPERCMFGSNWPLDSLFSDYETLVNAYRDVVVSYSDSEKAMLFRQSAERLYRI